MLDQTRRRPWMALAATGLLLVAVAPVGAGETTRVSVGSDGVNQAGNSSECRVSGNGRFVVFSSAATGLVEGDTNQANDIFARDRKKGRTTRVSVRSDGGQANGGSLRPAISKSGRFIAFESNASNLVEGDDNGRTDVFVHDRRRRTTERVNVHTNGTPTSGAHSIVPSISANGRFVVFSTSASDLVDDDTNRRVDIFLHDRKRRTTERVSVRANGEQSSGTAYPIASVSRTGRYVVFQSSGTDLVPEETTTPKSLYIRDRRKRTTTRIDVRPIEVSGDFTDVINPVITPSGRYVVFAGTAANLSQVYHHDRKKGVTTLVTADLDGRPAPSGLHAFPLTVSANGRFVAFQHLSPALVQGSPLDGQHAFVRDVRRGVTTLVSVRVPGSDDNVFVGHTAIAGNGRFVAFSATAPGFTTDDGNDVLDVFVRDLK